MGRRSYNSKRMQAIIFRPSPSEIFTFEIQNQNFTTSSLQKLELLQRYNLNRTRRTLFHHPIQFQQFGLPNFVPTQIIPIMPESMYLPMNDISIHSNKVIPVLRNKPACNEIETNIRFPNPFAIKMNPLYIDSKNNIEQPISDLINEANSMECLEMPTYGTCQ